MTDALCRVAAFVLLSAGLIGGALANELPVVTSQAEALATLDRGFAYDIVATDADGDTLGYTLRDGPDAATLDAQSGALRWKPQAADIGLHGFVVVVDDGRGGQTLHSFELRVVQDFCPLYPIALPTSALAGLEPGARVQQLPRGTGPGNFSWLTWSGGVDAPTLAQSLLPPGDSYLYRNPDHSADTLLDIGDWAQGATGSMNASAVRDRMDALIGRDIVLPVWDATRGQGSRLDYRVEQFAIVRLTDYRLTGKGWLSFELRGYKRCYNDPPSADDQTLATSEDTALAIELTASDPEDDTLAYTLDTQPQHGQLSGEAPDLVYTPAADFHGRDRFTFHVDDGEFDSNVATVIIDVAPVNDPPQAFDDAVTTDEDVAVEFSLRASDVDGDPLTWELLELPQHGTLGGTAPGLIYTPGPNFHGADALRFIVHDAASSSAPATVTITVRPVNDPPRFTSVPPTQAVDGKPYRYPATAADPDVGDVLRFVLVDAPTGMTIDAATGVIDWVPTAAQVGTHPVTVDVFDLADASDRQTYVIEVERGNLPPQIVSPPVHHAIEASGYAYDVDAVDPNEGDVLTYRLAHRPDAMAIAADSGVIGWAPPSAMVGSNLEPQRFCQLPGISEAAPPPAADVVIVVDESGSMNDEHAWIADISAPLEAHLVSNGVGTPEQPNRYGLIGYEANARPITVGDGPMGDFLQLETATRQLRLYGGFEDGWRAVRHGLLQYPLRERASKNIILITDEDRDNADGSISYQSLLAELKERRAVLNAVVDARFVCEDGSAALGIAPGGAGYKADGRGGYLTCSGARATRGGGSTIGDYVNLALATDGAAWDLNALRAGGLLAQSFTNALLNVKVREIIEQAPPTAQADLVIRDIVATDEGPVRVEIANRGLVDHAQAFGLSLHADAQALGTTTVDALAAGEIRTVEYTWARDSDPALFTAQIDATAGTECIVSNNRLQAAWVRAAVSDSSGLEDRQGFTVTVRDSNSAPQIVSTAPTTASVGTRYSYQVQIDDPDLGDGHEYVLLGAPSGFTLDAVTGRAGFRADAGQLGTHEVTIAVRDLAGSEATQTYTLQVDSSYAPPRFASDAPRRAVQGTLYRYETAVDADPAANLQYDVFTGPDGMSIDAAGVVSWQVPDSWYRQTARVVLRVRDQFGNYDLQMVVLVGDLPNEAPKISGVPTAVAQMGSNYTFGAYASDRNVLESFTWRFDVSPPGATIGATNGVVSWPGAAVTVSVPTAEISAYDPQCRIHDPGTMASLSLSRFSTVAFARPIGQTLVGPLADTNYNGRLDNRDATAIVAISSRDAQVGSPRIHAFDVRSRGLYWSYNARTPDWLIAPAMAALRGDTDVTILFVDSNGYLVALSGDGQQRWVSAATIGAGARSHNAISVADLDADGQAEILAGPSVFDADGNLLWQFPLTGSSQSPSLAVDIDGDGRMEVAYRDQLRSARGELLWTTPSSGNTTVSFAYFSPARLAGDGSLQLVVSEQTLHGPRLSALNADGSLRWQVRNPHISAAGSPLVADFDGDGLDEIFLSAAGRMYSGTGEHLWSATGVSWYNQHHRAAVSADLDGDGGLEIIGYAAGGLTILSRTGVVLGLDNNARDNGNLAQVPAIVDIHGSGQPSLIVGSNHGIREYLPVRGQWRSDARVFHQHAFSVDQVEPDLGIPPAPIGQGAPLRQMSSAASVAVPPTFLSDLHVGGLYARPMTDGLRLEARVTNRGMIASLPFKLEFHRGTPQAPGGLITSVDGPALAPTTTYPFMLPTVSRDAIGGGEMYALIVPHIDEAECEAGNNVASGRYFQIAVADHGGLEGDLAWVVGVVEPRATPAITSTPATTAVEGETYAYDMVATSTHVGDALTYVFATAPAGATIDPDLGHVRWTPGWGQSGRFRFHVLVRSQTGRAGVQYWDVTVSASQLPNTAPAFVSAPVTNASIGEIYRYQAEAQDAEGHEVAYALAQAPSGMQIDALTGSILWVPGSTAGSPVPVTVTATDERGAISEQAFQVTVHTLPNRAPTIDSTPLGIAYVGQPWEYVLAGSDPDGDPLTWVLDVAPGGMTLDADNVLRFTPTLEQLGPHAVEVQVGDGRGGWARQGFELQVYDTTAGNTAPTLSGTPPSPAVVGQAYSFQPGAADADGDALTFSLIAAPVGMAIDSATGLLQWTPSASQVGTHAVGIRVDDGRGGWATLRFDLAVIASGSNNAPIISSTALASVELGSEYRYQVIANDVDGDPLAYRLAAAPAGMQVSSGGFISWLPRPEQVGVHPVDIVVDDGRGGVANQAFELTVSAGSGENRAPTIVAMPFGQAKVGRLYRDRIDAFDADGDTLAYVLTTAPAGMTIDTATGAIEWTPDIAGAVDIGISVSDAALASERSMQLQVHASDVPLSATLAASPDVVAPGDPLTITLGVDGAAGPVTVNGELAGQPLQLVANGSIVVAAPGTPGPHTITARIDDGYEAVEQTAAITVGDPNDTTAPTVKLLTPAEHPDHDAVELSAPTQVTGEVLGSDVTRWMLVVQERGSSGFRTLAQGTQAVAASELALFDPTSLINGQYLLVLQAWDASGNMAHDSRIVRVTGDMKIGHFSISFEEASVPVAGIPVTVTRTYDTRRAHQSLDFGHGWTVDARSLRLQESRRAGFSWTLQEIRNGFFSDWCVRPNGDPIVTVTMPDGELATFKARAEPECSQLVPQVYVELVFDPVDNTRGAKLEQTDYGTLRAANMGDAWHLIDLSDPELAPVDPRNYRLTTAEGLVYDIDQAQGLRRVTDPASGHTLTYSADGVRHSTGVGIDFIRDGSGRISQIRLPDGETLDYGYTAAGDLETVADQIGGITSFAYDARIAHYLRDIVDPRGVRVARNEYDDAGRLIATTDAEGHRFEFEHAIDARTERVRDRNGHWMLYQYDANGRVIVETNLALGTTIQRSYDDNGNLLSETDAQNRTRRWTYDARGNVLTETDAEGATITRTYNAQNQLLSERGPDGVLRASNEYDSRTGIQLTRATNALGETTSLGYSNGSLVAITDATGATTRFGHDFNGFLSSEADALGHVTAFANDAAGRVLRETRTRTRADGSSEQLVTRYTYDAKGRVVSTEYPDGSIATVEYNGIDKPIKECDPLGRCKTTEYDARGNVARVVHPDSSVETRQYDASGNLVAETDRAGRTTKYVFDAANRIIETIFPDPVADNGNDGDNPRVRNVYDAAGQLVEVIDENGHATRHEYDAAGRRIRTLAPAIDGVHAIVVTEYDGDGRVIATTDAAGGRTRQVFDAAGRHVETVHPDGRSTRTEYDAVGRKTAEIDEAGRITRYGYDALSRLVIVVLPNPATGANPTLVDGASPDTGTLVTRYLYDEVGNKIAQIDAEGRTTRWEYDVMGRETARILPGGQRETRQYNLAGELVSHTDFNGATTRYHYDLQGRLERTEFPNDADVQFGYNAVDERVRAIDGRGTSTRAYDRLGRVVQSTDADGGAIEYEYDSAGNLIARISPHQSLLYAYDARNRLTTVTRMIDGEAPLVTHYEYDDVGRRIAMEGGDGVRTEYAYDVRHRLTGLVKRGAAGALMLAMSYSVDASGLRTGVEESDPSGTVRTVEYRYDGVRRLTDEIIVHSDPARGRVSAWSYDRVGNRLAQMVTVGGVSEPTSYAYDANDRLLAETTGSDTTAYAYDANGNTIERSGPSGTVRYTYDDSNRLIEASSTDGVTSYVYDADGLRVRQTVHPAGGTPVTTWYVQDASFPHAQVIETHVSEGAGSRRLAAAFAFADELIAQTRFDSAGLPATGIAHADGFGSVRWLTTTGGAITDAIEYDAFGSEIHRSGTTDVEHLYRGEAFDSNVGFYYLRARWMDPAAGRFTTVDEWAGRSCKPVTLHKYLYADADPVNGRDPSGYMTMGEVGASLNIQSTLLQSTGQYAVRRAFARVGCELGMVVVDEAITYGIYVLFDGTNFYVGQSNDIDRRQREHLREAQQQVTKRWKAGMQVVARFNTPGGRDALRIMEQYVMDVMRLDGNELKNAAEAINMKRGRLRGQYRQFMRSVCK